MARTERAATMDTLQWTDANMDGLAQPDEIVGVPGTPAGPSSSFSLGADILVRAPIRRVGELVRAHNLDRSARSLDPVGAKHTLKELGWYAAVTQIARHAVVGIRYVATTPTSTATPLGP